MEYTKATGVKAKVLHRCLDTATKLDDMTSRENGDDRQYEDSMAF